MSGTRIRQLQAWEVLDSRGRPTVCARVELAGGAYATAAAPSGASTGQHERVEQRDGGRRYGGAGVRDLCRRVEKVLAPLLVGTDADDPAAVAEVLDSTGHGWRWGGNVSTAVSVCCLLASARQHDMELWQHLARRHGTRPELPLPMVNIVSGGAHANGAIDIQDVLAVPVGATGFAEAVEMTSAVRSAAAHLATRHGAFSWLVADEGGIALPGTTNEAALTLVTQAIEDAGYRPGTDVALAVDVAANQFAGPAGYALRDREHPLDARRLGELVASWCRDYPIVSVEDPLCDDDLTGWAALARSLGGGVQLLGDDLTGTQLARVGPASQAGVNSVLVKVNQAGTVHHAWLVTAEAHRRGMATVLSARSGDTEDAWLADVAVGWATGQIKVGSLTRSERLAKWNRLLELEHRWNGALGYAGMSALAGSRHVERTTSATH